MSSPMIKSRCKRIFPLAPHRWTLRAVLQRVRAAARAQVGFLPELNVLLLAVRCSPPPHYIIRRKVGPQSATRLHAGFLSATDTLGIKVRRGHVQERSLCHIFSSQHSRRQHSAIHVPDTRHQEGASLLEYKYIQRNTRHTARLFRTC